MCPLQSTPILKSKEPTVVNVNPYDNTHFRVILSDTTEELGSVSPVLLPQQADTVVVVAEADLRASGTKINEPNTEPLGAAKVSPTPSPPNEEIKQAPTCLTQQGNKTDSPSRKKGITAALFIPKLHGFPPLFFLHSLCTLSGTLWY